MNDLTPTAIVEQLATSMLPKHILCFDQVGSTMDIAREQLRLVSDDALPLLIVADEQTAGRGRLKRSWVAPPESAILFSLVLRPSALAPSQAAMLVWMAGVALCEGIAAATHLNPRLKWPNDVMVDLSQQHLVGTHNRASDYGKIAGILLESSSTAKSVRWAIVGCGINVSASPPLGETRYPSTNIQTAQQAPVSRLLLLRAILQRMDYWYSILHAGNVEMLFQQWRSLLITLGNHVQVTTTEGTLQGFAEDVEPSGALCIRDAQGKIHHISSGDVGVI